MSHDQSIRVGIIGGTGLGQTLVSQFNFTDSQQHSIETPFGPPSGPIVTGSYAGTPIALLNRHGEGHVYNPSTVPYRANIYALKQLGCTHLLASGAVGSLREEIVPGDIVLCDQLIDRTMHRHRTFFENAAVHVEFADPVCPVMRKWLLNAAGGRCHDRGTYICIEGPSFSTRSESHMHRQWGADVVGMTALPEARLAREAEMAYALVALPTDYDCWRVAGADHRAIADAAGGLDSPPVPAESSLIEQIIANLKQATAASITMIQAALSDAQVLRQTPSPAHSALDLGIWTEKAKIDPAEIDRLAVLWERHFRSATHSGDE